MARNGGHTDLIITGVMEGDMSGQYTSLVSLNESNFFTIMLIASLRLHENKIKVDDLILRDLQDRFTPSSMDPKLF
jgi:hypothetical protein